MPRVPPRPAARGKGRQIPGEEYLSLRTPSGPYQIEFAIDGRRVRESSGTADKGAAAALALKRWDEVWRQVKLGEAPRRDLTLTEAFIRYYDEKANGTAWGDAQRYQMRVMLGILGPQTTLAQLCDDLVNTMVQSFRTRLDDDGHAAPLSPATINRYLTTLSSVCRRARKLWAVEVGEWTLGDHMGAEPEGREVFLDHAQARKLLAAACGHLRPILLFDLLTGLRRANVLDLEWEQVSIDLGRAVMVQKGNRRLGIALPPMAVQLLERVQPDPAARRGRVFVFGNPHVACDCAHCVSPAFRGDPIKSVKRAFATAARTAGVRDMASGRLRFHDLRHTFASWLLAEGGDLKLVQEALGHRNIGTTARYAHLLPGRKEATIAAATAGLAEPMPLLIEGKKVS